MARKRALKQFSEKELLEEIARRHADKHFRDGMTMSEIELSVEELKVGTGEPSLASMLSRMKPEKLTAKACPKCGKRVAVKARDRERTVRSLAGPVTFRRNYHYCEKCHDRLLDLAEAGEGGSNRGVAARIAERERQIGELRSRLAEFRAWPKPADVIPSPTVTDGRPSPGRCVGKRPGARQVWPRTLVDGIATRLVGVHRSVSEPRASA